MAPTSSPGQPLDGGMRPAGIATTFSSAEDGKAARRRRKALTAELQRVVILLTGGGIALLFLLLLARSLNPADHELLSQDLSASFAALDGQWAGQTASYNARGGKIAEYFEQRVYHSASTKVQTLEIIRDEGSAQAAGYDVWVHRETADGTLVAARSADGEDTPPFEGHMEGGHYFWQRETASHIEIHRLHLTGNTLFVEELRIPRDKASGLTIVSGRLQRADTVDHSPRRGVE